jgi:hypothetical protein
MVEIHRRYDVRKFKITDDNFLLAGPAGVRRAEEFAHLLLAEGMSKLKLDISMRIDAATPSVVRPLMTAGLERLYLGLENFCDDDLAFYNKGYTGNEAEAYLEQLTALGFSASVRAKHRLKIGMIVFHPFVTWNSLRVNASAMRKYRMPPKKLRTRLWLYKGASASEKVIAAGLWDNDNEWGYHFPTAELDALYTTWCAYLKAISPYRETLRWYEKAASFFADYGNDVNGDSDYRQVSNSREQLDQIGYDCFMALVTSAELRREVISVVYPFIAEVRTAYAAVADSGALDRVQNWTQSNEHAMQGKRATQTAGISVTAG